MMASRLYETWELTLDEEKVSVLCVGSQKLIISSKRQTVRPIDCIASHSQNLSGIHRGSGKAVEDCQSSIAHVVWNIYIARRVGCQAYI